MYSASIEYNILCRQHPYRRLQRMAPDDGSTSESDNQMRQVMADVTDVSRRINTTQTQMKVLQIQVSFSTAK